MHKISFFIGIDSGGTKTELLISDANSNIIHKSKHNSFHYSIHGKDLVAKHLEKIIRDSLIKCGLNLKHCKGICIGLAGVRESADKAKFRKRIVKLLGFKKILIESDSIIAFNGAFKGGEGLMLICGTGSILFGKINNKFFRIGGWGWKIGDYGSGYEIGKNAVRNLVYEYNRQKKLSNLSKAIESKFSLNRNNILQQIYRNNFEFQKLVPLILEYASKKDKEAHCIINKAVEELLIHFKIFFSTTGYKKKINVAFSGSIIEEKNPLSDKLKRTVKRNFKNINLVNKILSPPEGAILLVKNKFLNN